MVSDVVSVEMRNSVFPHTVADQANVVLSTAGVGTAYFFSAAEATGYYIAVKHRNSIETWSADATNQFVSGAMSYNFTTAQSKAFQ